MASRETVLAGTKQADDSYLPFGLCEIQADSSSGLQMQGSSAGQISSPLCSLQNFISVFTDLKSGVLVNSLRQNVNPLNFAVLSRQPPWGTRDMTPVKFPHDVEH